MDPFDESHASRPGGQPQYADQISRGKGASEHGAKAYLSENDVAQRLNMSVKWVQKKRHEGGGVPYHRFGSRVRYLIADVLEYEARARRLSTSDPGPLATATKVRRG